VNLNLQKESTPMKIVLFSTDFNSTHLLMQEIKKSEHLVMETIDDPNWLIHEINRTTPHLLVAHAPENLVPLDKVRVLFPDLPVCLLRGNLTVEQTDWRHTLQEALGQPIQSPVPRPYADDTRFVCHDESLQGFWKGKLNRPEQKQRWEDICSNQEARFVLQLQTGRKNHAAAKRYFECLLAQQTGLDQELAYRLAHGSYKALSWSRDLAVKWLALLAHYVPDAELEYLPIPGTPGPAMDFVHHDMPAEGMYAAALVVLSTVKPSVAGAIQELATARFDGQDEHALLALSLKLYGMAKFLGQVGGAQIELMDAWLDPAIVGRSESRDTPRGESRNAGLFRDFYDLTFIVHSPEPLASILKGFHAGTTYVEERRYLPSFAEFRRLCRHKKVPPGN
jgi:hypothetical protein